MEERRAAGKESPVEKWPWAGPWPRGDELKRPRPEANAPGAGRAWKDRLRGWRPRRDRLLLVGIIVAAAVAAIASVLIQRASDDEDGEPAVPGPPQIQKLVAGMTPAQKADAVLATGFTDANAAVTQASKAQLGGFVVTAETWPGGKAGRDLTARISAAGAAGDRVPPLLITRQEGGPYNSLPDLPPPQRQIDVTAPELAESNATQTGQALRAAGFHVNLAPVADVATLDSPIADRAFGDDPDLVRVLTGAAVRGCRVSGVACAASHFPGLGGASNDPAEGPATVSLDAASLESRDLFAFEAAFDEKIPAVVLSLAAYPTYDPVTPAALSPTVIQEVLRTQYAFDGVAITDDLSSGAITGGIGVATAAVEALTAGADLIQVEIPEDAAAARTALADAIRSGEVPADRMNQAVARVLILKKRLGLLPAPPKKQRKGKGKQKGA